MKDIFKYVVKEENLSKIFKILVSHPPLDAAKNLVLEIAEQMNDKDGNFIQQFQTTGFYPRLWEIFLFKFFKENGINIIEKYDRPDFHLEKDGVEFFVEASLSNEKENDKFSKEYIVEMLDKQDYNAQQEMTDYYVIRMGSVLFSKLNKEYWKLEWVKNKPIIIAITPAHHYLANFLPDAKVVEYLYGLEYESEEKPEGLFLKKINKIEVHKFGEKEIPSNFFAQPNAEHISAVIFTNNSDLHKFNRMGYQLGLTNNEIIMERAGLAFDETENSYSKEFTQSVIPGDFKEDWNESVSIFHNPNAMNPLDRNLFLNVRQVWIEEDGRLGGNIPKFFVFHSKTLPVCIKR